MTRSKILSRSCRLPRGGFTIVELLVVISILVIMAAILIPQVRMFNKERGIREAARVLGSALQEASLRARAKGSGGVVLLRNQNYRRGDAANPVFYSCNEFYQARLDVNNDPLVDPITRAPLVRSGTRINLPSGYRIDLNYSGPLDVINADLEVTSWTQFSLNWPAGAISPNELAIVISFNESGGVRSIYTNGLDGMPGYFSHESIYFCITTDNAQFSFTPGQEWPRSALGTPPARDLLDDPAVLWVQLNCLTGRVAVLESIPPVTPLNTGDHNLQQTRILQSRGIATKGLNAAQ
jgi:prepilin-type N-terminal cleavage/methylation domain-containing protein